VSFLKTGKQPKTLQKIISPEEKKKKDVQTLAENAWWAIEDPVLQANAITQLIGVILQLDVGRIRQFIQNQDTYASPEYGAPGILASGRTRGYRTGFSSGHKQQVAWPLCWSAIQTLASKIATNDPKPQFLTSGGDYKARKNAELLTNLTRGVAYETDLAATSREVFIDACIGGTGYVHAFENWETHKIDIERVFPAEIITDPNDDIYGCPRSMYRIKYIDRDELHARFPDADVGLLASAQTLSGIQSRGNLKYTNMIMVVECWHLPSSEKATDGRHVIATSNDCLNPEDREYERRCFPIIPFRYDRRRLGYTGMGICELVGSIQNNINEVLQTYQTSISMHGVPKWIVPNEGNVLRNHLNDLIGSVIGYDSSGPGGEPVPPPQLTTFPSMPSDVMQWIETLSSQLNQSIGVSILAVSSQKPQGLNSGEAIRTFVDVESDRFQMLGKNWEAFHVEIYKHFVELATSIAEEQKSYPVRVMKSDKQQHTLEVLDWKDAKGLIEKEWEITCFPISSLPSSPAGQLEYVQDLMQLGPNVIDPETALELLNFPDTSSYINLRLSGRRLIEKTVYEILDSGKINDYVVPDTAWGIDTLQYGQIYGSQSLQKAVWESVPEKNIAMLAQWLLQCSDALKALQPPPQLAQPQGAPAVQPLAAQPAPTPPQGNPGP